MHIYLGSCDFQDPSTSFMLQQPYGLCAATPPPALIHLRQSLKKSQTLTPILKCHRTNGAQKSSYRDSDSYLVPRKPHAATHVIQMVAVLQAGLEAEAAARLALKADMDRRFEQERRAREAGDEKEAEARRQGDQALGQQLAAETAQRETQEHRLADDVTTINNNIAMLMRLHTAACKEGLIKKLHQQRPLRPGIIIMAHIRPDSPRLPLHYSVGPVNAIATDCNLQCAQNNTNKTERPPAPTRSFVLAPTTA
ncbi:hypothetical protein DFH27DRAFT_527534 [Peziza echinospora]|nr:hypothetical protein DFH27DRAFT_527534 [Peziza echinospora]